MHEDQIYTNVSYVRGKMQFRGIDLKTGKRIKEQTSYNPRLYISNISEKRKGNYVNLDGEKLSYIEFGSPYDSWEFIKEYDSISDFQIYGQKNFSFDYISRFLWKRSQDNWNIKHLRIGYIDIECESEDGFPNIDNPEEIINVITVYVSHKKRYATFCVGEAKIDDPDVDLYCFDTEQEMLYNFLAFWRVCDFDIITGWNCGAFDMSYLYSRTALVLGEEKANQFSPHNKVNKKRIFKMGREQTEFQFVGMSILDYFDLYMKYAFTPLESYKLDTVAKHENIKGKNPWQEKYGSMKEFYTNNFQEFVEYNIQDVTIVKELEHKLRFIELHCSIAYMAGVNFDDALSPIRTWEAFIYNKCYSQEIICPIKNLKFIPDSEFQGAYVKEPKPGLYKWVASFDVTSLYPSIMRALNISPETYIKDESTTIDIDDFVINGKLDESISSNKSLSANGQYHTTTKQGILPQLITEIFDGRTIAKNELNKVKATLEKDPKNQELIEQKAQLNAKQMALKILLNSLYGAVSNKYFLFYNLKQAEAVTLTGQLIIQRIAKILNDSLNTKLNTINFPFIIYVDTDSNYLNLNPIVEKVFKNKETNKNKIIDFLDNVCKREISPMIHAEFKLVEKQFGWIPNYLKMNREIIAEKALWTGKKRYVCLVNDTEGIRHEEPKIKITGIEVVRSSTPDICREWLKKSLKLVLGDNESDIHEFVNKFRTEFMKASIQEISFPRSANGLAKYKDSDNIYGLKTPVHTKGSLLYNHQLRKLNLTKKYPTIIEGEKIKFIYLLDPNPLGDKVIAFPGYIPKEFGLEPYIDKELMFQKSFIEPLNHLLDPIGWSTEERYTLE